MEVFLVNESSALTDAQAWAIAWACNYQARFHFGRSGWRSDVRCIFLPGGGQAKVPPGGSVLHLLDSSDQQGALGYHTEDGQEIPYARVFVKTIQQGGGQASEVASHELLELAADPNVNLTALTGDSSRLYALEVGDPCQGQSYDVGALEGRTTGVVVANFALPAWFDPGTTSEKVDFRGLLSGPFTLAPQGYAAYIETANFSAGWQQAWGQERSSAPPSDADDRLAQRLT